MVILFIQSSFGQMEIPDFNITWFDKILHFVVFGILGILTTRGFNHSSNQLLKQRELSSKNAEAVVARYVSDLDELSRLEPVGFYCNGSIENPDIFEGRYWIPTFSDSTIFYIIARSR